ncbi:hypothetical protein I5Q34_16870 [Streptomyces sp. AV19]|uniref:hypothetical protein n=1 Tax=Streptomyces sp. AV19 TaxID=2793068 RepID=UPI0018FE2698|nr:hypothetical protein [Streptomyces sp. AV19]MBH1935922.1 hypothetical protein [Streptomyces sp. AV19]MDG4534295.1 hypothetical protein [Streptomyces sp. AV19]
MSKSPQQRSLALLRETSARLAVELHDAFRAHGFAVTIAPESPVHGEAYVSVLDPLREEEARLVAAALRAYRAVRRESLSQGVAAANARSRRGGLA